MGEFNLFNPEAIQGFLEDQVGLAIDRKLKRLKIQKIKVGDHPEIDVSTEHPEFVTLLKAIASRLHVALVGPAGSGKTTSAKRVSELLNLPFYTISVGQSTGKHEFFGYQDAHGNYVTTLFRQAYENGGVFLIDEFDAGNANVFTAINSALANGECAFPNGMVARHKDFVCIIAGNTYGNGGDNMYVGRSQIDAATLDRFVFLEWDIHEELETKLAFGNNEWLAIVRKARENAAKNHILAVIGVRAVMFGAQLIASGIPMWKAIEMCVFKGLSNDECRLVLPDFEEKKKAEIKNADKKKEEKGPEEVELPKDEPKEEMPF